MSRIGIGANMTQPNKQCLNCKYWKPAKKDLCGLVVGGYCSSGYCKKNSIYKKRSI